MMRMTSTTILREMTVNIRGVGDDVWRKFKALCTLEDISMGEKLTQILEEAVSHLPDHPKKSDKPQK